MIMGGNRMVELERDPRIYFAAERTFLAWIRTGLALMGLGFVVARFGLFLHEVGIGGAVPARSFAFSIWVGTALVLAGVLINGISAFQHLKIIRNLNDGRDVTGRPSAPGIALAIVLGIVGIAMSIFLVVVR